MEDQAESADDLSKDLRPKDVSDSSPIIYESSHLLQGRREVWIEHGSDMYRLRLTASGKLYLTK